MFYLFTVFNLYRCKLHDNKILFHFLSSVLYPQNLEHRHIICLTNLLNAWITEEKDHLIIPMELTIHLIKFIIYDMNDSIEDNNNINITTIMAIF